MTHKALLFQRRMLALAIIFLASAAQTQVIQPLIGDYFLEKAEARESGGKSKQAFLAIKKSLAFYRYSFEARFFLARLYQKMGSYHEACAAYEEALKLSPYSVIIRNNLGSAYLQSGRVAEAINSFKQALSIDNSYAGAHYNLALAYRQLGQDKEAELHLERVRSLDISLLVDRYLALGNFDDTTLEYHKTIKRNPDNAHAYFRLGQLLERQGDRDSAIPKYKKVIELDPAYIDAYVSLAKLYRKTGNLNEAIIYYAKGLEAIPHKLQVLSESVSFYSEQGMHKRVLEGYRELERLKDIGIEAEREYKKAIEAQPRSIGAYLALGSLMEERGLLKQAILEYEQALKLEPENKEAFIRLEAIRAALNSKK